MRKVLAVILMLLAYLSQMDIASANVCSANTDGRTAICGEPAGQCFYQATWGGDSFGPYPNDNPAGVCCYDPAIQECGAGAFILNDDVATPVVTAKKEFITTSLGRDLDACGVVAIPTDAVCRKETSCTVIGYDQICPFSKACTNDLSRCNEISTDSCPGANQSICGGVCYDNRDNFCYESTIYSKDTHFKCGGELFEVGPTQACCGNQTVYNPQQKSCTNGIVYDPRTEGVCGSRIFTKATQGCCSDRIYTEATNDCSNGHIVQEGNRYSRNCRAEYNPETQSCQKGKAPFPGYEICKVGEKYALNRCYEPRSADFGEACASDDQCIAGKCNGIEGLSRGQCVCQTDRDCGANAICKLGPLGIGKNQCIATAEPTCRSGWSYEIRNPLNKDRCNRTTTQTAALKCKLLATDKAKNWTGPHAQAGADECRSTKGKQPKGVKCPRGYDYRQRPGADTCTKTITDRETPTCPPGWDYKSQKGKDVCQEK